MSGIAALITYLSSVALPVLRSTVLLAGIFTVLPRFVSPCNISPAWWRKPDLSTDLCWAFVPALIYGFAETSLLILGILACYGISDPDKIAGFFQEGHGPLGSLNFWPQVMLYLVGSDLVMYFTHRLFHGATLWRFHAVHHSSRHLEWTSAPRFHPVDHIFHSILSDVVMLLLGIPPEVLILTMPFDVGTSALVHANLDWTFGPFRYLLASPVFHRWHHTSADRGGSSNFAGTFPLIDLVFGTFHMPSHQLPDAYGIDDAGYPTDFFGQMLRPLMPHRQAPSANEIADKPVEG